MGGSASAPTFFDPHQTPNHFDIRELVIDGAIICNNPAMYAFMMAKYLKRKNPIRVVSVGTGRDFTAMEKLKENNNEFTKISSLVDASVLQFLTDYE